MLALTVSPTLGATKMAITARNEPYGDTIYEATDKTPKHGY